VKFFVKPCTVEVIFFDFGGVLAEEGFRNGIVSIAKLNGLDPEVFVKAAFNLVFEDGFVVGRSGEETFWQSLRDRFRIKGADGALRSEVLSRFKLRPWMMQLVKDLRDHNIRLAILSDQTHWLDELDAQHGFFKQFDRVFNSYHTGKSKKDPSIFDDVVAEMGIEPTQALFVDDNMGNIQRAKQRGLHTILYQDRERFQNDLARFCHFLER
jgi:putative hydrolase of the HAD superfamily